MAYGGKRKKNGAKYTEIGSDTVVDLLQGTEIPPGYEEMGVETGFDPPAPEELWQLWIAFEKCGKTTVASSIPNALLLDFDIQGARTCIAGNAARRRITSWQVLCDLQEKLLVDAEKANAKGKPRPFKVIVFDDLGAAQALCDEHMVASGEYGDIETMSEYNPKYYAGYRKWRTEIFDTIRQLYDVGYGIVCTFHIATGKGDDDEPTNYVQCMPALWRMLCQRAQVIAEIERKTKLKTPRKWKTLKSGKRVRVVDRDKPIKKTRAFTMHLAGRLPSGIHGGCRLPLVEDIALPRFGAWAVIANEYTRAARVGIELTRKLRDGEITLSEFNEQVGEAPDVADEEDYE